MTTRRFTCEKCLQIFDKGWSDEEALKEYAIVPWNIPGDEKELLCDDCFKEFKVWFDSLTPRQHRKIKSAIRRTKGN